MIGEKILITTLTSYILVSKIRNIFISLLIRVEKNITYISNIVSILRF